MRGVRWRSWRWALPLACVVLASAGGFSPLVRARIRSAALRRGVTIDIGHLQPRFGGLVLEDVRLALVGVPGVTVRLARVEVELDRALDVGAVLVSGARVDARGAPDELLAQVRAWRSDHQSIAPSGARAAVALRGVGISGGWTAEAGSLAFEGLEFEREGGGYRFSVAVVTGTASDITVSARTVAGGVDAERRFYVGAAAASLEVPVGEARAEHGAVAAVVPPTAPGDAYFRRPDIRGARAFAGVLATFLSEHLDPAHPSAVEALTFTVRRRAESFAVGPGAARLDQHPESIDLSFVGLASAGAAPIRAELRLPMGAGDVVASLDGGPISLSMLGVEPGALGVAHPERSSFAGKGRVVLGADGQFLTFDIASSLRHLSILQPRVSAELIEDLDLGLTARGELQQDGHLRLDEGRVSLGAFQGAMHGALFQAPDHLEGALSLEVPPVSCQALAASVPRALLPHLVGVEYAGVLSATLQTTFDSRDFAALALEHDVRDSCRMRVIPPQLRKARFAGAFEHEVVGADGHPRTLTVGPGTDRWTDLEDVSPFMAVAVQTTEDAGFYRHHGFNAGAIRASIIANLRAHRFVRGASTITMQLAKNLFLSREKTLSRKLEEVVLTDYLEDAFTKDELMELYLNVVEFGPDIYGVGAAAEHYFGRTAAELSLGESLLLATILPNPIGNHKRLYERREMPDYWAGNLIRLMGVAAKAQRISPAEYAEGVKEHIQLFHVGDPAPQPREPARGGRPGIGNDDEMSDEPQ